MVSHKVALGDHSTDGVRKSFRPLAHDEKGRLYARVAKDGQDLLGARRVGPVVEGERYRALAPAAVLVIAGRFSSHQSPVRVLSWWSRLTSWLIHLNFLLLLMLRRT